MTCAEAEERRLVLAAEPGTTDESLAAHLRGCDACRRFSADLDRVEAGLAGALRAAVSGPASEGTAAKVLAALPRRRRSRAGLLVAAGLLVTAAGVALTTRGPRAPGPGELLLERAGESPIGDGAWVRPGPDARARVVSLAPRRLSLEAGRLDCRVRPGSGSFVVQAPHGRVSVVGTEFSVFVLPPGGGGSAMGLDRKSLAVGGGAGALVVTVLAGVVLLEADGGGSAKVHAGQVGFADARGVEVAELASLRALADRGKQAEALEAELAAARARLGAAEAELRGLRERAPAAAPSSPTPATSDAGAPAPADPVARALAGLDWGEAARALARNGRRGARHELSAEELAALSRLQLTLVELAKALGTDDVDGVFDDPRVVEAYLPAWVDALGTNLDPAQRERLRQLARRSATGVTPGAKAPTYLRKKLGEVRAALELDATLAEVLRPEQRAAYVESVGDDPFFGSRHLSTRDHGSGTPTKLAESVTDDWLELFRLDPALRPLVQARALDFVTAALGVPAVDRALEPIARRRATLERTARLIELQLAAEEALAAELPVDDAARARIQTGSPTLINVGQS